MEFVDYHKEQVVERNSSSLLVVELAAAFVKCPQTYLGWRVVALFCPVFLGPVLYKM